MLYLDTSATIKLVESEAETGALRDYLRAAPRPLVTSRIGIIELRRIARRHGRLVDRADLLAATLAVIELDRMAEARATLVDPSLRTLDAIHLGAALSCGPLLRAFVCYDGALGAAAAAAGLRVDAPGRILPA